MKIEKGYAGYIYYETAGEGESVLFIHGIESDRRLWDNQFKSLAKNHKVIRIDLRGFGNSEIPVEKFSNNCDILKVLDMLGLDEVHLIGFSFGAVVTVQFAIEYPGRVRSVTLISPGLPWHEWSVEMKKYFSDFQKVYMNDREEMFRLLFRKTVYGPDRGAEGLDEFCKKLREMFEPVLDKSRSGILEPFNFDRKILANISVPALIITGEKDFSDYHVIANTYHLVLQNSELVNIKGHGHLLPLEAAGEINYLTNKFISSLK